MAQDEDQSSDDEDSDFDEDSDSSEEESENNAEDEKKHDTLDVEDGMSDIASVLSDGEHAKEKKTDPKVLLQYAVPEGPEDEAGLTTDSEESEWESPETRMKKVSADICVDHLLS